MKQKSSSKKIPYFLSLCLLVVAVWLSQQPRQAEQAQKAADAVTGTKIMVLNYHKVENIHNSLAVVPKDFEAQLQYLQQHNYHTITPEELLAALTTGAALPENPVMLTFDDGYADNYQQAFPLLKKYGMKGVIFVVTSFLDRKLPGYLTWEQAREMEQSGLVSIQSHTYTHPSLTDLKDEQRREELKRSKQEIEEKLDKECLFVAYPTGTYDLHIASLVREAGYRGAFTIRYANVDLDSNIYALERMPIFHTSDTMTSFYERMQYVPAFSEFGWEKN